MIKAWKSFSIFALVALIFLLAPATVLLPGENVAQGNPQENVTQEVEVSFLFSETAPGAWCTFTAGSGGIQAPGPCLEQYTRENVVRNTTLADCGFRNYTTGSGNVAGDLTGTISLAWNTFKFNQTYPYTPKYYSGTDFGFMMGRGHFYDGTDPSDNFTFVFVLDFDSNGDMSAAGGKGFMVSVEENGTFMGHKIIGDFDISKSGPNYTGNFHLRNYDPSEVHNLGNVNIGGGFVQDLADDIHAGLDLVSFTLGGPMPTPTDIPTDFEEIAWGRDPIKNVNGGPLGLGGTMDLSRNAALYLSFVMAPTLMVHIQGTTACNQYINDTYAVTGNDGSPYGELWQLSLLDLPYQELPVDPVDPIFFIQAGYTFTPFGLPNPSSECYAGTESFALTTVAITALVGAGVQASTDQVFGLYPHPKVESVTPATGSSGQTMNVTIKGEYFLRVAGEKSGWVPNSGSVSFGDGITVNSYTIKNSSPIDNSITASITIDPGASTGARDVNVTSCFGYTDGNGTEPYKSGVFVGSFMVSETSIDIDFNQMNFTFDGNTTYNNTEWGSVDFTFIGQEPIMYFNLAVNGSWQVQNIPVLSDNGVGVEQTMTYYFDLGTERGTDVTSVNYDYAFTSDILNTMPGGSIPTSVGDDYVELWAGSGGEMPNLAAAKALVGGEVSSNLKHHHTIPFPNQDCDRGECAPAAVSNSLTFLNTKYNLGMKADSINITKMKDAVGFTGTGSPIDTWWELKKNYTEDNNYPITTRKITNISELAAEIDAGQVVEIQESWWYQNKTTGKWKRTGHTSALVGIEKLKNGNYSLDIADDVRQGVDGKGCGLRTRIYDNATGNFTGGGYNDTKFEYAVVECYEVMTGPTIDMHTPIDDTFKAPVGITTIHNVSSWKAGFRFDPHILECVNVTEGPYLSDVGNTTWTPGMIDNVNGTVTSYNCTLEAGKSQNGTGVLANVTFRVKNYGKTVINLTDEDGDPCESMVLDSDWNEILLAFVDGEVTVREPGVGGIVEFPQIEEPGTAIPDLSDHNYSALARIIVGAIVGTIILISAVWYVRRRRAKAI